MKNNGAFVGLSTFDIEYPVDYVPGSDEKITADGQYLSAGGPATNAAVTFSMLSGKAWLASPLGTHFISRIIGHELKQFGVDHYDISPSFEKPPPISSVLVTKENGNRAVVSANTNAVTKECINPIKKLPDDIGVLLIDGHYIDIAIEAAQIAKQKGIPVVIDAGSWKEGLDSLLPLVDIAICSERFMPPGCQDINDTIQYLKGSQINHIAISRGGSPIIGLDDNEKFEIPVKKTKVLDTLGAGDILHGAFCHYWLKSPSRSFQDALREASKLATFSCEFYGTREWNMY